MNDDPTSSDDRIEDALRSLSEQDQQLMEPPAELWDRISSEVSAVSLEDRRKPKALALLAAAAAIVVILGAGYALLNSSDDIDPIAQAELAYDPDAFDPLGADASATATLVDRDGALHVEIADSALPTPDDADLEVWLIEPDADGNPADLVSLGTIDPDEPGDLEVPSDRDPDVFFVVDISVEPRDGDPTHSGRSILRGPLAST